MYMQLIEAVRIGIVKYHFEFGAGKGNFEWQ